MARPVQKGEAVSAEARVDAPLFVFLQKPLHPVHVSRLDALLQLHTDHVRQRDGVADRLLSHRLHTILYAFVSVYVPAEPRDSP